jgi:hypothetical protein
MTLPGPGNGRQPAVFYAPISRRYFSDLASHRCWRRSRNVTAVPLPYHTLRMVNMGKRVAKYQAAHVFIRQKAQREPHIKRFGLRQ